MWRSGGGNGRSGRRALVAAAAVLVVVVGCAPPPSDPGSPPTTVEPLPEPPHEFSVLAYNVAGLPQEISEVDPQTHIPLISPLLNEYDVVLTQEDFDWWVPPLSLLDFANYHTRLRADATHPYRTDVHPGPEAVDLNVGARQLLVGDGIGIMSRFPLTDVGVHPWSRCFGGILPPGAAGCLAMKGFRVVTMTLGDGALVDVYSLHAEAGNGPQDRAIRAQNFIELAEVIATRSAGRAVIVGGDTNTRVADDGPLWPDFLAGTGLVDVCEELDCPEPTSIDKFAYRSGGGVELSATSIDFPRERFTAPGGSDLSDHPPVVAEFVWDRSGPATS